MSIQNQHTEQHHLTPENTLLTIVLPMKLGIEPMARLLVASFKGDPEFEMIEPQVFDDTINGTGMRILRYRKGGKIDIYWQAGVHVDRTTFAVGSGISDFTETTIEPANLEITEDNIDLHVGFVDLQGRKNELHIHENIKGERGFPLLAPVGGSVKTPPKLMLVFMPKIDLVRRSGSFFVGRIGDRTLRLASFPILLNWCRVWFARYVSMPIIGYLNPPMNQPVKVELFAPGCSEVDGMNVTADKNGSVSYISAGQKPNHLRMDFLPSLPNLLDLSNGNTTIGSWSIRIAETQITGGSYKLLREGNRVIIEFNVTEKWKPSGLPLSMKIFTLLVRSFRTWPTTYKWRGVVELGPAPTMSGIWERKK